MSLIRDEKKEIVQQVSFMTKITWMQT